jgi:hypothetical protein
MAGTSTAHVIATRAWFMRLSTGLPGGICPKVAICGDEHLPLSSRIWLLSGSGLQVEATAAANESNISRTPPFNPVARAGVGLSTEPFPGARRNTFARPV